MAYYKKLKGNNVYLSPIDIDDALQQYKTWRTSNDLETYVVFSSDKDDIEVNDNKLKTELEKYVDENAFAIVDIGSNKLVGLIGLSNTLMMNRRSNLWFKIDTYMDFDKQVAYGIEALELMLDYSFYFLGLYSILIDFPSTNKQALEICKDIRAQYMATRNESIRLIDNIFDSLIYFQTNPKIYEEDKKILRTDLDLMNPQLVKKIVLNDEDKMREIIEGEKISLKRPYEEELFHSAKYIASFLSNPKISISLGEYKINWTPKTVCSELKGIDYLITSSCNKDDVIGYINLFSKNEKDRTANLEIVIGNEELHNKGYATEALNLFLEEQYNKGIYNSIISNIFSFNGNSQTLHRKIGFKNIGTREEAYFAYGELNDMEIYEMNKSLYNSVTTKTDLQQKVLNKK